METRSVSRHLRIAPRKARLVIDLIRGKNVGEALNILEFVPKKGAQMVAKTLKSALANAEHTQNVDVDRLYVKHASVGAGKTSKRFTPRAQGRATPIRKRTSHVIIVVDERS
jgi:large subunit ribosomal protein L22